ncbi:hypothetical protein VCHA43P277_160003 [Vibrio chagasii]|nr:hypothetical protein VCHA34P126_140042 [Vibrio chagasii]CAH6975547.1 hypothetical protein VCHA43P277_160003 [Vibrio chagasii]CAH7024480.1 hypothetical protein VCHA41O247_160003 [Vibrio chagasii]CAH7246922.1 hypothetical protein VCHA50P420_160088 [Vibrio chagasii]
MRFSYIYHYFTQGLMTLNFSAHIAIEHPIIDKVSKSKITALKPVKPHRVGLLAKG